MVSKIKNYFKHPYPEIPIKSKAREFFALGIKFKGRYPEENILRANKIMLDQYFCNYIQRDFRKLCKRIKLTEESKKEKDKFLLFCLITIVVCVTDIFPKEIPALGLDSEDIDRKFFLISLSLYSIYQFIKFIVGYQKDRADWILIQDRATLSRRYSENSILLDSLGENWSDETYGMMHDLYSNLMDMRRLLNEYGKRKLFLLYLQQFFDYGFVWISFVIMVIIVIIKMTLSIWV